MHSHSFLYTMLSVSKRKSQALQNINIAQLYTPRPLISFYSPSCFFFFLDREEKKGGNRRLLVDLPSTLSILEYPMS